MRLPFGERRRQLEQFEKRVQTQAIDPPDVAMNLSAHFLPAVMTIADREESRVARREMFLAALEGSSSGTDAIEKAAAGSGRNVKCLVTEEGFELTSQLSQEGRSESMTVGAGFRTR